MAILDDIKTELRISGTDHDTEITGLINAAKTDLEQSGIAKVVDTDYLSKMAIILYCKANFGYEDIDQANRLQARYEDLRAKLAVASDYNQYKITFNVYALSTSTPLKDATIAVSGSELVTNSLGVAYAYLYDKEVDVNYAVRAAGYIPAIGSVYVDDDETVSVVMTA